MKRCELAYLLDPNREVEVLVVEEAEDKAVALAGGGWDE